MYENKLAKNAKKIDIFLKKKLNSQRKTSLNFPMRYGLLSGGKKIRSSIIINAGKIYNLKLDKLINVCAAVECIHSYSLIHDDLPCMDNDKFRRGKLSTHAKYGEATAVLAGNSLLTFAFEMITDTEYKIREKSKLELVNKLAFYSGHEGIAGGQDLDLNYENKNKTVKEILAMQKKKTGKLFNFCCFAVACLANRGQKEKNKLGLIGEEIGLLFQIADDILDLKGSKKMLGKSINKDKSKGKSTLIDLIGYKNTLDYAKNLQIKIFRNLKKHGKKATDLCDTVKFILERNY
ncbi:MAG: geranyl transferase [Pelagibacteraceae bacterium TMED216]|nr:MAG: geranyl transferase [Pelagibacteraceae bacterium TMED216]|tara:strand:+ start:1308 stop:2183 length:876 start_codon:yes stop_codon:yes gene_type:complete